MLPTYRSEFSPNDLPTLEPGDISDAECSFQTPLKFKCDIDGADEGNQNANSCIYFPKAIGIEDAVKAGRKLNRQDVISLVFLLIKNSGKALELCETIENDKFKTPLGPQFMYFLVYNGNKLKVEKWDLKIVCALHMIKKWRSIKSLCGLEKSEIADKFEKQEYYYLDSCVRVKLFQLFFNLKKTESTALLKNSLKGLFSNVPDSNVEPRINPDYCMETNLLKILHILEMHNGNLTEPLTKIIQHLPSEKHKLMDKLDLRPVSSTAYSEKILRNGLCIILNQVNFKKDASNPRAKEYENREGSIKDEEKLEETWKRFDCEVWNYRDLTSEQICSEFRDLAEKKIDFGKYGFLVVCILSHGDRIDNVDYVIGTDGVGVDLRTNIYDKFLQRNPHFSEKLTLFIVQACRGRQVLNTQIVPDVRSEGNAQKNRNWAKYYQWQKRTKIASEINGSIIFNSTIPDYVSFRDIKEGTFFIRKLCLELQMCHQYHDLSRLLHRAMDNLTRSFHVMMPIIESTFGKTVYLYDCWAENC